MQDQASPVAGRTGAGSAPAAPSALQSPAHTFVITGCRQLRHKDLRVYFGQFGKIQHMHLKRDRGVITFASSPLNQELLGVHTVVDRQVTVLPPRPMPAPPATAPVPARGAPRAVPARGAPRAVPARGAPRAVPARGEEVRSRPVPAPVRARGALPAATPVPARGEEVRSRPVPADPVPARGEDVPSPVPTYAEYATNCKAVSPDLTTADILALWHAERELELQRRELELQRRELELRRRELQAKADCNQQLMDLYHGVRVDPRGQAWDRISRTSESTCQDLDVSEREEIRKVIGAKCCVNGCGRAASLAHLCSTKAEKAHQRFNSAEYTSPFQVNSARNFIPLCGSEGATGTHHDSFDKQDIAIVRTLNGYYLVNTKNGMQMEKVTFQDGHFPYKRVLAWHAKASFRHKLELQGTAAAECFSMLTFSDESKHGDRCESDRASMSVTSLPGLSVQD